MVTPQSHHPASARRTFSFEFFPPNTPEGATKLAGTARELAELKPEFFSVTYGAGGSTQERTLNAVLDLCRAGYAAAPHISCIGSSRAMVKEMLERYRSHGIKHLVALRGDLPSGTLFTGDFHYASELVAFIRQEFGDQFFIEVAAYPEYHPQAKSAQDDLANFKRKVIAGANSAITQYFYNADCYFHFVEEARAMASRSRSCRASCRSAAIRSLRASRMRAAPRFRAGSARSSKVMATTRHPSRRSVSTW